MGKEDGPSRAREEATGWLRGFSQWVLFRGNRLALTGIVALFVFVSLLALTTTGYFAVGAGSNAGSLFSSGLTAGVLTVVTLVLSINQLVLSRIFGSPGGLSERLAGTKEFRANIERLADVPVTPNDPAAFLSLQGDAIANRADDLRSRHSTDETGVDRELVDTLDGAVEYGSRLDAALEPEMSIAAVLDTLIETEYAEKITEMREARTIHADRLDERDREDLQSLEDLFDSIAITRQFFKTLALQENLARLSRIMAITGLLAFFTTISLGLLYRSNDVTIDPSLMPFVTSLGLTIVAVPVVAVIVYVLRAATIARHTASVGPFVQPAE